MNAKQFKYVLVLAQEGSFSKAAAALNISQPSLSQYIKKIEYEIGAELFDRSNGDVRITDAGRIYIKTARQILDLEHQMEATLADIASHKSGSITIGVSPYRAASMMPVIASEFQKIYPGMHLIIREGTTSELIENMAHGEYDLTLTLLPAYNLTFNYEMVMEEELILAVPSSYPQFPVTILSDRKYPAVSATILDAQKFVMLTETQFMQRQLQNLILDYNLTIHPAAIVKSLEAQIEMVKAGIGMALVPSGIEAFCKDSTVSFYSFAPSLPKREVAVMWRKDQPLSKAAEELKKLICNMRW